MRLMLWAAFFITCNIIGVEFFKTAVTLPLNEAITPGVLTLSLMGLSAVSACQMLSAWREDRVRTRR